MIEIVEAYYEHLLPEIPIITTLQDISDIRNEDFQTAFADFESKLMRIATRLKLKLANGDLFLPATAILISDDFRSEAHKNIETIRKIINQATLEQNKKDAIFSKIASLQSEIDRSRTTFDEWTQKTSTLIGLVKETGIQKAINKSLELWAKTLEFFEKADRILPQKINLKRLPAPAPELDDEIPF